MIPIALEVVIGTDLVSIVALIIAAPVIIRKDQEVTCVLRDVLEAVIVLKGVIVFMRRVAPKLFLKIAPILTTMRRRIEVFLIFLRPRRPTDSDLNGYRDQTMPNKETTRELTVTLPLRNAYVICTKTF